jgi:hypothetical protein
MIDRERFTQARYSCLEPVRSVGNVPVGELSLSGEPECLSLQGTILTDATKTGKRIGKKYLCAEAQDKLANRPPLVFPTSHTRRAIPPKSPEGDGPPCPSNGECYSASGSQLSNSSAACSQQNTSTVSGNASDNRWTHAARLIALHPARTLPLCVAHAQ